MSINKSGDNTQPCFTPVCHGAEVLGVHTSFCVFVEGFNDSDEHIGNAIVSEDLPKPSVIYGIEIFLKVLEDKYSLYCHSFACCQSILRVNTRSWLESVLFFLQVIAQSWLDSIKEDSCQYFARYWDKADIACFRTFQHVFFSIFWREYFSFNKH